MRKLWLLAALSAVLIIPSAFAADASLQNFITAQGDQLMDGDKPFRFISWNIPNLLLVEDNFPFNEVNAWRLPDRFEITDGLATVREMGGTVVRAYSLSAKRADDLPGTPQYVLGPGQFNEEAFKVLDIAIQVANQQGIRLVIPLVNNWTWQGGRGEYAAWRGKTKDDFWTDPQLFDDYKRTIDFVLNRTNTLTGVRYKDDKAILCWETGNEVRGPAAWTRKVAAYIKSVDHNHLVMDGFDWVIRPEVLEMPEVGIVTTHQYPGPKQSFAELIRRNAAMTKGKKPYIIGEFGFVTTDKMEDAIKVIRESGAAGGLLWSLRFHDRDGGFYWHWEDAGANLYKAFHWPGSPVGDEYDERQLMALVRSNAYEIRGLPVPPIPAPQAPNLLPIADVSAISWQGSIGAASYSVERAPKASGPWVRVTTNVDESFTQYRPQFSDEFAPVGNWYYRIRAQNDSGESLPSNIVGPVSVSASTMVDELADFSRVQEKTGSWEIRTHDTRKAKEDIHRAAGVTGDKLVYELPTALKNFRVYVFFPKDVSDIKFSTSSDGVTFHDVTVQHENYFGGPGDYGYWQPVFYHANNVEAGQKYLKMELTGETQISRVEITRALGEK